MVPALEELAAQSLAMDSTAKAIQFEGRWYTRGELRIVANKVIDMIEASGADARSPVALIGRNRPEAVAALLGLIAARRNIRMIYGAQSPVRLGAEVDRLIPAIVIGMRDDVSDPLIAHLREKGLVAIALEDMNAHAIPGLEHLLTRVDPLPGEPRIEVLTSGTTGPPKSFPVSYDLIARHLVNASVRPGEKTEDLDCPPALLFSPMANIGGVNTIVATMVTSRQSILVDRFTVAAWRDYIVRYRPSHASVVPAGVQMILDADLPPEDLSSLKSIGSGAAAVDPVVQRAFEARYGIPLLFSYGATEFAGPVTAMTLQDRVAFGEGKATSIGRPMPGVRVRVVDAESGAELQRGEQGLLEVVTPRIGNHWIRTADLAVLDEDGFVFHRGRADGAIMRGGFKILPEIIERALMLNPAIACVAVVGVPDRRLGEVPGAVIETKPGAVQPLLEDLETTIRETLLSTHVPVVWRFVEAMPRTVSLKVDRQAIKRLLTRT